jgi:glycosyltransferase involved in cell wall biosynthesis
VIFGEGNERKRLLKLVKELGLGGDVDLPGFTANPYRYMQRADVFVLSSIWEGSPNVLTEAMALGTQVTATDCPSGPREILQNGQAGRLVAMGDPSAMAIAIEESLRRPLPRERLQEAVYPFYAQVSVQQYKQALFPAGY